MEEFTEFLPLANHVEAREEIKLANILILDI